MGGRWTPPDHVEVRGARVHNLKNIDVDVPLHGVTAIAGVSGSGKSSLALGVLHAEGSRRYLESLSTYTRRRLTQASGADVDSVRFIPASLALRQRPGVPGIRSTFGTASELANSLRLMFSRLASHVCPRGHHVPPDLGVAAGRPLTCPECGAVFDAPGAEDLSFNSRGACRRCSGTGLVRTVNLDSLVPDRSLTIDEGAVAPWNSLMWSLMKDVCRAMGVRTDVPFRDLTEAEKDIVYHGPAVKKHIFYRAKNTEESCELDFTYYSAVRTVENALGKVKDEKGMKRVERFLREDVCPDCAGTRLSEAARAPLLHGLSLDGACALPLDRLRAWVDEVPDSLPEAMRPMARAIAASFDTAARRLLELGLSYLSLDRATATLSTGERQRVQLARAVRNRSTGVLYVLDEPSIGLHPYNLAGLCHVMRDLAADGNSIVLVDHEAALLRSADWLIEMGPGSGSGGGAVICQGGVEDVRRDPASRIGPFLGDAGGPLGDMSPEEAFSMGAVTLETGALHTVRPLRVRLPKGRLTAVTGVSGSGKTTLVLESLVPGLQAAIAGTPPPSHVLAADPCGLRRVRLIDAAPIGVNVRSTVATYADVHDELRRLCARTPAARERGWKAGDFSYNTGRLRCPVCDGTGSVTLDVQFLPDVDIPCPSCRGTRYAKEAEAARLSGADGAELSLPGIMALDVDRALAFCAKMKLVRQRLEVLRDLGLGYLTLGEETPGLSGGEAQRLKLAGEMGRGQEDALFVFDEPTIGLHPLDVRSLMGVFRSLTAAGATVVVIEHDLDVIRAADHVIDMGPGGGLEGGRIVAEGSPLAVSRVPESRTGAFLRG